MLFLNERRGRRGGVGSFFAQTVERGESSVGYFADNYFRY